MQPVTRVIQNLGDTAAIKILQALGKPFTDQRCWRSFLTRWRIKALGNIVALQPLKSLLGVIKTGSGHAPGTDRCPHQINRLMALTQPVPKNKTIQRPENQPFGATRCSGDDAHMLWRQSMLAKMSHGLGAGINTQSG